MVCAEPFEHSKLLAKSYVCLFWKKKNGVRFRMFNFLIRKASLHASGQNRCYSYSRITHMTFTQLKRLVAAVMTACVISRCQLDCCFKDRAQHISTPRIARTSHPHPRHGIIELERQHCHCWVSLSTFESCFLRSADCLQRRHHWP